MSAVSMDSAVRITFSEAMDAGRLNRETIVLRDVSNATVSAIINYDPATHAVELVPEEPLKIASRYTVSICGGAFGVMDRAGNTMQADINTNFATVSYGASAGGPGGPILVVTDRINRFSSYYAEILLSEGLNQFEVRALSTVSSAILMEYDVVILGEIPISQTQAEMLANWVEAGGNLIAMRPGKHLAALLGIVASGTTLAEGYLMVDTDSGPGAGITGEAMQFHGTADRYTLEGASSLADLYSNAQTPTANPAVTLQNVGSHGGQAAAFAFDLARSVVYTRQGNPAWAGQDRDGLPPMRPNDLFHGAASNDPQPDWVDRTKVAIPQSDEQQRLLVNLILFMNADRMPLPRFWYFPHGHKAAVVMTGDDHAKGGTEPRFDQYHGLSQSNGSVENWETIRGSSYIFANRHLTNAEAVRYNAAGFEIALHLNTGCGNYTPASLENLFKEQLAQFRTRYPGLPPPTTHRAHCIAWSGYTTLPETESRFGIRLNTSYYYWPSSWVAKHTGLFTGSGMPMRFATAEGATIDVYQAATQATDESGQAYPDTINALLDRALGPEGYYGAFVANMHTDDAKSSGSDAILASAKSRNVPVISARQLLKWVDARNSSAIKELRYQAGTLEFAVEAGENAKGLIAMVPIPHGQRMGELRCNGETMPFQIQSIKGVNYAMFAAVTANYELVYIP